MKTDDIELGMQVVMSCPESDLQNCVGTVLGKCSRISDTPESVLVDFGLRYYIDSTVVPQNMYVPVDMLKPVGQRQVFSLGEFDNGGRPGECLVN